MIKNFSDHAANERTFLAWVRTALAIAAFGLATEKLELVTHGFNTIAGIVLVSIATLILIAATYRFVRLSHHLARPDTLGTMGVPGELLLAGLLAVFVAIFGFLLWAASGA